MNCNKPPFLHKLKMHQLVHMMCSKKIHAHKWNEPKNIINWTYLMPIAIHSLLYCCCRTV